MSLVKPALGGDDRLRPTVAWTLVAPVDSSQSSRSAKPMSVAEALALASRRSGRPIGDVRSATYVSAVQLEARLAENPAAARDVLRFEPHWRIQFAGHEAVVDEGDGPVYTFALELADDVLIFADGSAMTFFEQTKGA